MDISEAKNIVEQVLIRIPDDSGAPFEMDAANAFTVLKNQDPAEWERIKDKLKKYGVNQNTLASTLKDIGDKQKKKSKNGVEFRVKKLVENSIDLPKGSAVPKDHYITADGVFQKKIKPDGEAEINNIIRTPVVISARTDNIDNEQVGLELYFMDWNVPKRMVVTKRQISDANQILELADFGISVTSKNRGECVLYFDKAYSVGRDSLPRKMITSCTGWVESNGILNFLLGEQVFRPDNLSKDEIRFVPKTEPSRIVGVSMKTKGKLEPWLEVVKKLTPYRHFVLGLGIAFGSPLIHLIQTNNIIFHFTGESTKGKTTILMVTVSVYGFPGDSTRKDSLIAQYRSTDNGVEARAEAFNGLPLLLDEAHQADEKTLAKIIYMLANGSGKNRAFQSGEGKPTKRWCNIVASTGERSLHTNASITTTGQEVRCVEITKSPFDEDDTDKREFVDNFRSVIMENYGHAGAVYIQKLVDVINDEKSKSDLMKDISVKTETLSKHQVSQFHARVARHFAVMWVGVEIADNLLSIFEDKNQIEATFIKLYTEAGEKWKSQIATIHKTIKYIWDVIESREISFDENAIDRLGHRCNVRGHEGAYAFIEAKLDEILERKGINADTAKKQFKENEFVVLDDKGSLAHTSFDGNKKRRYVFHRDLLKGKVDLYEELSEEEKEQFSGDFDGLN